MNRIGDAQFRFMCEMWGVDAAVKAAKGMGLKATDEQIAEAQEKERAAQERWKGHIQDEGGHMKHPLLILLTVLVLSLTACQTITTAPDMRGGYAEILMPGNTLVTGHYDQAMRPSYGWIKVHLNGKWYAMSEWRVVLKEE